MSFETLRDKAQFRPIQRWPGDLTPHAYRKRSPFSASWGTTLDDLDRELYHLGATAIVIQLAMREEDFRIDGLPRANANAEHPGIVLSFNTPDRGRLEFATDLFRTWQENVRAIALGLEALRKVDRFPDGAKMLYRGPSPKAGGKKLDGREHCARPEPHKPLVTA